MEDIKDGFNMSMKVQTMGLQTIKSNREIKSISNNKKSRAVSGTEQNIKLLIGAMTVNAAGANGLTCQPKHGEARDNIFSVAHLRTDKRCLTSAIACRSSLSAGLSSFSRAYSANNELNVYRAMCCCLYMKVN
jgi:hypothetical protein